MQGIVKQMLFFQPHAAIIETEDWSAPIPVVIPPRPVLAHHCCKSRANAQHGLGPLQCF